MEGKTAEKLKKVQVSMRPEIFEKLKADAIAESRSQSGMIHKILIEYYGAKNEKN